MRSGCKAKICGVANYRPTQPDISLVWALEALGIAKREDQEGDCAVEGIAPIEPAEARRDTFSFDSMPDASLVFACCVASQPCRCSLTGVRTLRVKETDRIAALANELRKVGCTVETGEDWIEITPNNPPHAAGSMTDPIIIETYNDHRMAMAFAVLGLNPPGGRRLAIRNPKCVAKSYPGFWKDFAKLYQ
jgi:3-phosphoshikimate 1-carboxyvinyltransferase